jgi:outer membrane protein
MRSTSMCRKDRRPAADPAVRRPAARGAVRAVATAVLAFVSSAVPVSRAAALPSDDAVSVPPHAWMLRTRAVMSGSSTHSEPAGYKVYSGIGVEAGIARELTRSLAVEFTIRTESREVDVDRGTGADTRLGSLELLPLSLMVDWSPLAGTFRPYVGAGINLTTCWEKSGALDDTQVSPSVSPAVQAGVDIALSSVLFLNMDARWNLLRTDLSERGTKLATLRIDPLTLGLGIGARL